MDDRHSPDHSAGPSHSHHRPEGAIAAATDHASHTGHQDHAGHEGHDRHEGHTPEMFRDRLWVSLLLTIPILYFSEPIQRWFGFKAIDFPGVEWVNPVLATFLFFYAGSVFLKGARHELAARTPGMMTLISIAITVAYVYSLAVSLGLDGEPFYWELATLLDVMLLGHWMEMRSVQSASRALEHLASMVPTTAHKLEDDGRVVEVDVASLRTGDRILIRPGEQVPADGVVVDGASDMNEAFLTGESRPVPKRPGDEVVAGAVNGEGALTVEVTRTGDETTLSQIMRLVEEAQASRSRYQALADRAAYWLTIIAIAVALPTLLGWLLVASAGITFAVARAVTVLVIACPHALGLAIPLVNTNATALSAQNGILVRNREAFERAKDIRIVAMDKTGTLTEGEFAVTHVTTDGLDENEALGLAAALERASEHPLAAAVVAAAESRELEIPRSADVAAVPGHGIEGEVAGRRLRIGRPEWARDLGLELSPRLQEALEAGAHRGSSTIVMMDEQRVLAVLELADQIRPSARRTVERLREMGVETVMITGDAEEVAATVAAELGIRRWHSRVLPQQKSAIVEELKADSPTAFVGDGINDAPALLAADLGIAIGAGTNVAIESADLVLVESDPEDVPRALLLARETRRKMLQNLAWATGYNAVALPLAAGVGKPLGIVLDPAVGALFMSLSTVIVAINAMALRRLRLD